MPVSSASKAKSASCNVASLRRGARSGWATPHRHHLRCADASLRQGQLAHFSVQARQLLSQAGGAIQFIIAHRLQGQNLGAQRIRIRQAGTGQYARLAADKSASAASTPSRLVPDIRPR